MSEQTSFAHLLPTESSKHWVAAPQRMFNSYKYGIYREGDCQEGEWRWNDFVLHLPAVSNEDRIKIFKEVLYGAEKSSG